MTEQLEKLTPEDGKSLDIEAQNIEQLKQLFPDVFREGKVDFEALKAVLGEHVEDSEERYNFTWHGKNKARQIAQTPSTGTLRPCKEESVNWDTTQNLFIEGDNLEVLKLLQKSYHQKVKVIYIDPPYNTGKDFVYKDNFNDNIKNYLSITGQTSDSGIKNSVNTEASGRYHTHWLNMIYPRLKLARNLLSEDGVIFISIDDNEVTNLRKVLDEIFGEDNFVANAVWRSSDNSNNDAKQFSSDFNHTLVYSKSTNWQPQKLIDKSKQSHYKNPDNDPKGPYFDGNPLNSPAPRENLTFEIISPCGNVIKPPKNGWRWSKESVDEKIKSGEIRFNADETNIKRRTYLADAKGLPPSNLWIDLDKTGHNRQAKYELRKLMPEDVFDTPKPVKLINYILDISGVEEGDIVLDFFAGSCTSAHAVIEKSILLTKNVRFMCVQLPELTPEGSKAEKSGFKYLTDIGKERIKRLLEDKKEDLSDLELPCGYKVLKLDETNINQWEPSFDNLSDILDGSVDSIKAERTSEDVLYEILLKYGLDLTYPITEHNLAGKTVYDVAFGSMIVCLDDGITRDVVEGIGKLKQELDSETTRVVFKDAGFADDSVKVNAIQMLKQYGVDDVKSI